MECKSLIQNEAQIWQENERIFSCTERSFVEQ